MQTDYTTHIDRPHHHVDRDILMEPEPPISVSRFAHVLRNYQHLILLSLAAIAFAYLIIAVGIYLASPAERTISQAFRLDFEGAGSGLYPNKTRFNIADIINGPILTRVWQDNHLGDYVGFGEFSRSIFVLESNQQYDALAAEYQAKLADPKLSPVDRERIQREFELKRESIAKNEYAIYFIRRVENRSIPDPLARKVLLDILNGWADFAVNQQHVIAYQVSVLSPEILTPSALEQSDLVASIEVLRSKANQVISNIQKIETFPGAKLARTPADRISLEEVRLRLDEIVRFRLDLLFVVVLHNPGVITDRTATIRFLESQLAYDQRQLEATQRLADSTREAIAVYEQPGAPEMTTTSASATKTTPQRTGSEAVTPQLSDTFLDRLMTLTGRAYDAQYRQTLVEEYRKAVAETIPLKQAVAYDTQVLDELRKPSGGSTRLDVAAIRSQIEQTRTEIGQLISKMNELFQIISRNMTPSTQLFTLTSPPITQTLRAVSVRRLALYGLFVLLIALPTIIAFCLLHNRIREEETAEQYLRHEREAVTSGKLP
jgi:hypothetical protein